MHLIPLLTLPISPPPFAPVHQPGAKAPPPFARPRLLKWDSLRALAAWHSNRPSRHHQTSIKAKTPAIKANQGISRHGMKLLLRASGSHPPCGVRRHVAALNWETCLPVPKRSPACALHTAAAMPPLSAYPAPLPPSLDVGRSMLGVGCFPNFNLFINPPPSLNL